MLQKCPEGFFCGLLNLLYCTWGVALTNSITVGGNSALGGPKDQAAVATFLLISHFNEAGNYTVVISSLISGEVHYGTWRKLNNKNNPTR